MFFDPISRIEWLPAASLKANDYNPNIVFNPELKLLEANLIEHGWIQPILIGRDGTIIDGFHRWMLAQKSKRLLERYGGLVPCVRMDLGPVESMLLTIRMNRAKGTHAAVRMSSIVKRLIDEHGLSADDVAAGIGGTKDEVQVLYQDSIFKARNIERYRYGKAWVPREVARK